MHFVLYAKRMIYIHIFTVIKSIGVGILAPGTGGIPNPTKKHSFIDIFRKLYSKGTTYTTLRFLDLANFN
jgi:hypothetical protein